MWWIGCGRAVSRGSPVVDALAFDWCDLSLFAELFSLEIRKGFGDGVDVLLFSMTAKYTDDSLHKGSW